MTTPIEYRIARQRIDSLHAEAARRRLGDLAATAGPAGRPDVARRLVAGARQRVNGFLHHAGSPSHA